MKTNSSLSLLSRQGTGASFIHRLLMSSLIIALLFASLPVHAALAAPAGAAGSASKDFEQEWADKMNIVRINGIFYERVRVYPADFKDTAELAIAHDLLNQYGAALRSAQRIIINRAGFDTRGRVVDNDLADQSLKELSANVRQMRILKQKLDQLDGEYRLLRPGTTTTAASQ